MIVSELISKLVKLVDTHGDIDVRVFDREMGEYDDISEVEGANDFIGIN